MAEPKRRYWGLLLAVSAVVAGVGIARSGSLPRVAGIGFAISMVLFVIGAIPDNALQSVAAALMIASATWIAVAVGHSGGLANIHTADHAVPA